jgi:hypothetical protein
MAVRKYHWDDKSRFLSVEEKEGEESQGNKILISAQTRLI